MWKLLLMELFLSFDGLVESNHGVSVVVRSINSCYSWFIHLRFLRSCCGVVVSPLWNKLQGRS